MASPVRAWVERLEDRRLLAVTAEPYAITDLLTPAAPLAAAAVDASTTTSLTASATQTTFGQQVTLRAGVSAAGRVPNGVVTFFDGQQKIQDVPLDSTGQATTVAELTVGLRSITAVYSGVTGLLPSTSDPLAITVRRASSRVSLSTSNRRMPAGQEVTFTARITGATTGRDVTSGIVAFRDGKQLLGYANVSQATATFSASALRPGRHSITATFGGDKQYTGNRSTAITQSIWRTTIVDLMVLYTPDAVREIGSDQDTHETIVEAVRDTNQALVNSRVPLTIRLVHDRLTSYAESGTLDIDLERLAGADDGHIDEADSLRDYYGADLVSLFVGNGDVGGMAYTLQYPSLPNNDGLGFSVILVHQAAAPTYTLAHELGHNFGAVHDPDNADDPGAYPYSYGYRFMAGQIEYRDIMAYDPGQVIPYFSNPDVMYAATPTGVAGSADVARTIRQTAPIVAKYRKQVVTGTVSTTTQLLGPTAAIRSQRFNLTATVNVRDPAHGLPAGRVAFFDRNTRLGSATLVGGKATLKIRGLNPGRHSIDAIYQGDGNFNESLSNVLYYRIA